MAIYKNKDIETNINERGAELGNINVNFYTEDNGTASIRMYMKLNGHPVDLNKINLVPRLDLYAADGSIFTNEEVEVIIPERGLIYYKINDYVIRHAGKMDAKLFLVNDVESIHVANFYFMIKDSGITGAVGKEIHVDILDDKVKKVLIENAETFRADAVETAEHLKPTVIDTTLNEFNKLSTAKQVDSEVILAREGAENLNERITKIEVDATKTTKNYSSIEEYGGVINDEFDNSQAFRNAINSSDNVYIKLPKGKINVSNLILPADKNITIVGSGENITSVNVTGQFLKTYNNQLFSTEINSISPLESGQTEFELKNIDGVEIGQMVTFYSNENMEETSRVSKKTHTGIITNINSNKINIDRGIPTDFKMNAENEYQITVKGYKVGKIKLSDMTVEGEYNGHFIDIYQAANAEIENMTIINKNKGYQGLISGGVLNEDGGEMKGVRVMNSIDTKIKNSKFEYLSYGVMPSSGSVSTTIEGCTALKCRHLSAATGGSQNVLNINCNAYQCYAGFDSHQTAYDTKHLYCNSFNDEISNKFRGRIDLIAGCNFGGGVAFSHDNGLKNHKDIQKMIKQIDGGSVVNGRLEASGLNVNIRDVFVKGSIATFAITNTLNIDNLTVELDKYTFAGKDALGQPIDYLLWVSFANSTNIQNVRLLGEFKDKNRINDELKTLKFRAIRIDRNDKQGFVNLNNIFINGFEYGIDFPSALDMKKFTLSDIEIKSCLHGINNAQNYKDNPKINRISFKDNKVNIVEPFRFRYSSRPDGAIKGEEYWDQTIKKKIIWDGTKWIDYNGSDV